MQYQDELPCGGYEKQDQKIQQNLENLSLEADGKPPKVQECCHSQQNCEGCGCQTEQPKKEEIKLGKNNVVCKKCKQKQAVLTHKNQVICKDCLMKSIEYKTRLTLENKIKVKGKSRILICFSGGLNSICLVNILKNIKKRYQKNPLFGELECVHIQQQSKLPQNYIKNFQEITGIKLHIIPIERVYQNEQTTYESVLQLFKKLPLNSNSQDLLQIFRDKLILDYAHEHNFNFVMSGKNGEILAAELFKYFTKGVGGSSGQLCSNQKGPFYYPLRQHLQKQLQYYFYTEQLGRLAMIAADDDLSNNVSNRIDNFLNNFITNLQDRYSHTAPAIVRTGEKLIRKGHENQKGCKWCYLEHTQVGFLCKKCERFQERIQQQHLLEMLPKWMIL